MEEVKKGFDTLKVGQEHKDKALKNIQVWLEDKQFEIYKLQLKHLIKSKYWDYLLDCFYQVIPFGTGGRRGEVGIGPNRINRWTIRSSAQGHSQYLLKHHPDAKERGVVLAYDVREFFGNKYFNSNLDNPVLNLNCKNLADAATEVYTANGILVYLFERPRTTPELSFAIRYLKAVAGDMFSASHNPPEHNGKKVYDEFGGQLIPPEDENLVKEVTQNVKQIKSITTEEAKSKNLIKIIGNKVDNAYIEELKKLSLSKTRDINIVFTPLHGTGITSAYIALKSLGFNVTLDPKTSNQSGKFENVKFNIPNPEVIQSFDTTLEFAKQKNADILLNCDPDADRIGIMVNHNNNWEYLNGNEIGTILTRYAIEKNPDKKGNGVIIKTAVTTNLVTKISEDNSIKVIGDLPVGFKYIGEEMNKLEKDGQIDNFLFGAEESHGYIAGNYLRDKDGAIGAIWLAELAAELKAQNKTLVNYLVDTYIKYGYFINYLTEIRLPGAEGMGKIKNIQSTLRKSPPKNFENFQVNNVEDFLDRRPLVSKTDESSKNVLVFHIKPPENYISAKVTVRPSGTEPKIKMYFELGTAPTSDLPKTKSNAETKLREFEKSFMNYCYKILGVDFPERGYLLFWQLPLADKLHYFEIEKDIIALKDELNKETKKQKLDKLLEFLGADPLEKINKAFKTEHKKSISEYLNL